MKITIVKIMNTTIGTSILFILLGVFLYLRPDLANKTIGYILGALILIAGASGILNHISNKNGLKIFKFDLIFAVLSFILGLFIIINPFSVMNFLTIGLGIWFLISGVLRLSYSFDLKKHKENYWLLTFVISIIKIIFGIMLIFNPFASGILLTEILGLFIIAFGLLNVVETFLYKRNIKSIKKIK